ncbi:MAG: M23 family metallopeptidase [Nocardioides sp.]
MSGTTSAAPVVLQVSAVEETAELPLVKVAPGKRKAVKHASSRGPLFRGLPSGPVLVGVATLAVAVGGAITSAQPPQLAGEASSKFQQASALNGVSGVGAVEFQSRGRPVSRDSSRDALDDVADSGLIEAAEQQAAQRNAALGKLAQQAEQQAAKIALNLWVYPTNPVSLTAEFGDYGLWASYHTGLDFNGDSGDPIMAIANGVVTDVGYDGSYGNKTVMTLEDGTEIWYAHQTSFGVSEGDVVRAGEVIGTVGATGNVTGSHLHLEVRPGGGDPVDPYAAMVVHGLF